MIGALAVCGGTVLAILALLHVYWAFVPRGVFPAAIPTTEAGAPVLNPGIGASLGVAALLLAAAFFIAERGGVGPAVLPRWWRVAGTAGVALVMLVRGIGDFRYVGLFKRVRGTPFARMDTRVYTPLVLTLAAVAGAVAVLGE